MSQTESSEVRCPRCMGEGYVEVEVYDIQERLIEVFEQSPDAILWTSEVLNHVDATRPTVLKHLNRLKEDGVLANKENVDTAWWLVKGKNHAK